MQLLLTCGLSVIFCVFVEVDSRQRQHSHLARSWLSRRWTDLEADTFRDFSLQESLSAIDACASVHSWMAEQSKEMGRYARFFNSTYNFLTSTVLHGFSPACIVELVQTRQSPTN